MGGRNAKELSNSAVRTSTEAGQQHRKAVSPNYPGRLPLKEVFSLLNTTGKILKQVCVVKQSL